MDANTKLEDAVRNAFPLGSIVRVKPESPGGQTFFAQVIGASGNWVNLDRFPLMVKWTRATVLTPQEALEIEVLLRGTMPAVLRTYLKRPAP